MPKPLLQRENTQEIRESLESVSLSMTQPAPSQTQVMSEAELMHLLRKPRSQSYMDACLNLDHGGQVSTRQLAAEIQEKYREEFPMLNPLEVLRHLLTKCYLGHPYEVHTLTFDGDILYHYQQGEDAPPGVAKFKKLVLSGQYALLEIYDTFCVAITASGTPSVIRF